MGKTLVPVPSSLVSFAQFHPGCTSHAHYILFFGYLSPSLLLPGCTSTPLVSYVFLHTISEDPCLLFPSQKIKFILSQYLYLPPAYLILLSLLCPPVPGVCSCHLAELLQGFGIAASGFLYFLQLPFQHPPSDRLKQTDVAETNDAFLPVDSRKK